MQRDVASVWKAKAFHIEGRGDFTMVEDEQGLEELQCVPKGAAGDGMVSLEGEECIGERSSGVVERGG